MKNQKLTFLVIGAIATFVLIWFMATFAQKPAAPLPKLGLVSSFQLTESSGKEFTNEALKGKIWVADFIFTTCGGICPVMTQNMKILYNLFAGKPDVHFVSISVNPETDSPQILKEYAARFQADTRKWHFLTGERKAIEELAVNSFKIGSVEEPVFHSGYFILVDRDGNIRGYFDGTEKDMISKLAEAVNSLVVEK